MSGTLFPFMLPIFHEPIACMSVHAYLHAGFIVTRSDVLDAVTERGTHDHVLVCLLRGLLV